MRDISGRSDIAGRLRRALVAPMVLAGVLAGAAQAAEYAAIDPPQPGAFEDAVEVREFFAYTCPHCFELEGELHAWSEALPGHVRVNRTPVVFSDRFEPLARAWYVIDALQLGHEVHVALFEAFHEQGRRLESRDAIREVFVERGVDAARFDAAYDSFGVRSRVRQARQAARDYRIASVPTLAVDGRYMTNASMTGGHARLLEVVTELAERRARERGLAGGESTAQQPASATARAMKS